MPGFEYNKKKLFGWHNIEQNILQMHLKFLCFQFLHIRIRMCHCTIRMTIYKHVYTKKRRKVQYLLLILRTKALVLPYLMSDEQRRKPLRRICI